jgi:hypothetical protein
MILGFSRMPYYEFVDKCNLTTFLDCHINAFHFYGGIPQEILYDRMKNVFIRQLTGKIEWNKDFYSFCLHYRFQPRVAPAYSPWVKGKIERPFHYVRENFWRGYEYRDIETANKDLREWNFIKSKRVHGTTRERVDLRFEKEKPFLSALPKTDFDTSLKVHRKVQKDCTIRYLCNVYVIPEIAIGHWILLKIKNGILKAFLNDKMLIAYDIPEGKGHFIDDKGIYQRIRNDAELNKRKYTKYSVRRKKGRAKKTIGIRGRPVSTVIVETRPITKYSEIAEA